jgi:formylglycine-generating enzyme required for sulfatase activity
LKPNDWGLFDVHGNVWIWCQDRYAPYPQAAGGEAAEDQEDRDPADAKERVLRGGAFIFRTPEVRAACRHWGWPTDRNDVVGLRPARTYS